MRTLYIPQSQSVRLHLFYGWLLLLLFAKEVSGRTQKTYPHQHRTETQRQQNPSSSLSLSLSLRPFPTTPKTTTTTTMLFSTVAARTACTAAAAAAVRRSLALGRSPVAAAFGKAGTSPLLLQAPRPSATVIATRSFALGDKMKNKVRFSPPSPSHPSEGLRFAFVVVLNWIVFLGCPCSILLLLLLLLRGIECWDSPVVEEKNRCETHPRALSPPPRRRRRSGSMRRMCLADKKKRGKNYTANERTHLKEYSFVLFLISTGKGRRGPVHAGIGKVVH
jgi:hypothetical protein